MSQVSGPIAIISVGADVARTDKAGLFSFAAIVNINLAVVNTLPLPALDGGYMVLLLIEALRGGKKLDSEVEQVRTLADLANTVEKGSLLYQNCPKEPGSPAYKRGNVAALSFVPYSPSTVKCMWKLMSVTHDNNLLFDSEFEVSVYVCYDVVTYMCMLLLW